MDTNSVKKEIGRLNRPNTLKPGIAKNTHPAFFRRVFTFYILALSFFVSCAPYGTVRLPVENKPVSRILEMKAAIVIKAVAHVLAEKKFVLNPEKTNLHYFQTEWVQDGAYRSMVSGEVTPINKGSSKLSLHIVLQKKKLWQEAWQPVEKIDPVVYDKFMNDVLIESYRVLYNGG